MGARRQTATGLEVKAALQDLDETPDRIPAKDWPGQLTALGDPGLYSWWVDEKGAADLSAGLGEPIRTGRIYAGLTGATKWPSGKSGSATLGSRIGSNHLGGRIRSSTFRLTLAASLRDSLELEVEGPKKLAPDSEVRLSEWIRTHLSVAVHPFRDADALEDLESKVLQILNPPLNLAGRPTSETRRKLYELRARISRATK